MSHFAQEVAARSQGHQDLEVMVCGAAQSSIGGRRKAQRLLSAPCRKKLWGKVRKHIVKQQKGRKSKVHSPTIQEKVNSFLLQNATVTGKLMKCQGAVLPVYNLKSSRGRLWARSPAMQSLLSRPVWYKHLRAHHANFVRLKCRTDVCTFCHKYDKVLLPALRKDLASARGEVESVDAKYFESFDKHWESMKAQNRTDPDDCLSLQHVKFFKLFLDKTSDERSQKATPLGTVAFRQRLKEAEAKASHMMANYLDVLESCSHHFQTVHRQHQRREFLEDQLSKDSILVQLDFMENMSWPLGPEEAQDWFWATSRETMTTLGFYVCRWKGRALCKENYHYVSQILNHDSAYACQCLLLGSSAKVLSRLVVSRLFVVVAGRASVGCALRNDLLLSLPTDGVKEFHCWADCGPHFRSYEFLWNLVEQCRDVFPRVQLHFFAEHHGKGRCDGAFGLQRKWVSDFARTSTIDSLSSMKLALETGAAATMSLDPPPKGPAYYIKVFEPESKTFCKKFDTAGLELQIEYTYCLLLERARAGHVRVVNYVFSDRESAGKAGVTVGRAECTIQKCTDEWRRSFRAQQPEKNPLNVALLQRRLHKQRTFADIGPVSRRDSRLVELRKREKRAAHARSKYLRQKRVFAVNLKADSTSSDETDSSSSTE